MKEVITSLKQQYLSSEHSALQKVVPDASSRIDKLPTQDLEITSQIKKYFKSFRDASRVVQVPELYQKSNILVFGVEDSPQKTPKSVRLQKDTNTVVELFSSLSVCVDPSCILDCFHLSKFKVKQIKS